MDTIRIVHTYASKKQGIDPHDVETFNEGLKATKTIATMYVGNRGQAPSLVSVEEFGTVLVERNPITHYRIVAIYGVNSEVAPKHKKTAEDHHP